MPLVIVQKRFYNSTGIACSGNTCSLHVHNIKVKQPLLVDPIGLRICTCKDNGVTVTEMTYMYMYSIARNTCTHTRANYLCANLSLQSLIRIIQTINDHHLMLGHKFGVNLDHILQKQFVLTQRAPHKVGHPSSVTWNVWLQCLL